MKRILLVSAGFFHPPLLGRVFLRRALSTMKDYTFQASGSLENLPLDITSYSALILYFHHEAISDQALHTFSTYVHGGGGVLALHSATASFKGEEAYFDILGGRFIGHGPVESFEVQPVAEDRVFLDLPAFVVEDELYLHEVRDGIEAHFTTSHEGQKVPLVWTYRYGEGRVCYAVPGHRAATMRNPVYQEVIRRGLTWAAQS